jgi:peptidyl-prolyl cis-trans isomerase D
MLKIMQSNKFFSVFLLAAITIMITVAFVFWGIGPKDNPAIQYVASVNDDRILLDEYYRAYDREFKQLKEKYSDEEIKKMDLPRLVVQKLVDRRVLLMAAEMAGLDVTEEELQTEIMNTPYFQRDGVFDVNVYQRALRLNRITPQAYESSLRNDLLIAKMSRLVHETAELAPEEASILDSIEGGNKEQLKQVFLAQKGAQNLQAYIDGIKKKLDIKINQEYLL